MNSTDMVQRCMVAPPNSGPPTRTANTEERSNNVEVAQLHRQIDALLEALEASQLEVQQWKDRCQILTKTLEEKAQTIAEIHVVENSNHHIEHEQEKGPVETYIESSQVTEVVDNVTLGDDTTASPKPSSSPYYSRAADALGIILDKLLIAEQKNKLKEKTSFFFGRPAKPVLRKNCGDSLKSTTPVVAIPSVQIRKRVHSSDFGLLEMDPRSNHEHDSVTRRPVGSLFGDILTTSNALANVREEEEANEGMSYADFLTRVSRSASSDILAQLNAFIRSVVQPEETKKQSTHDEEDVGTRYRDFFDHMERMLVAHPAWCYAGERSLAQAKNGIEKYIMEKCYHIIMSPSTRMNSSTQARWHEGDQKIWKRMHVLSFITPEMLDIKPSVQNEVAWSISQDELGRMNLARCPEDKMKCIEKSCGVIFSMLNLTRSSCDTSSFSRPGADDFLPIFIYLVLTSRIERLFSNCEYIAQYRNPSDLTSQAGYCLVNLRSAVEFILVADASMLSVPVDEFSAELAQAEALWVTRSSKTENLSTTAA